MSGHDFTGREDERLWEQDDARLASKKMCNDPERRREHALGSDMASCHTCAMTQPSPEGIQTGIPHVDTAEVKRMVEMLRSNAQDYHERYIEHEEFTRIQKDIWDVISMKGSEFVDYVLDVVCDRRPS